MLASEFPQHRLAINTFKMGAHRHFELTQKTLRASQVTNHASLVGTTHWYTVVTRMDTPKPVWTPLDTEILSFLYNRNIISNSLKNQIGVRLERGSFASYPYPYPLDQRGPAGK